MSERTESERSAWFEKTDILHMFPSFVWKAELARDTFVPMNAALLATLKEIGTPLASLAHGQCWQSPHDLHERAPFRVDRVRLPHGSARNNPAKSPAARRLGLVEGGDDVSVGSLSFAWRCCCVDRLHNAHVHHAAWPSGLSRRVSRWLRCRLRLCRQPLLSAGRGGASSARR